jgi:hypothetical protein
MNYDALLDARQSRRMHAEHRYLVRLERREAQAQKMIGELMREGKTVYYVAPIGGQYREGSYAELVNFLIRNHYV